MFESARLKLTIFYLAALLVFSIVLTFGLRAFVQVEFHHSNDVQRGAVHQLGQQYYNQDLDESSLLPAEENFALIQQGQAAKTQNRLTREFVVLNVGVFVVGAFVSYWYAGRTLRPIEEAHEQQKRFTADASHEMRTPLASMRLENEIFLRQKKFNDVEARAQVGSNLEEVLRLERLTTSLLDLSQYENVKLKLRKTSIREVSNSAVAQSSKAVGAGRITFVNTTPKKNVLGDRQSLTQLVGILLDNAVKYGSADGAVEISGNVREKTFALSVRDHGNGISKIDLPHVFDRMYRGDKAHSNTIPGHGIGLSLARQIATANKAQLEVVNHPEGGAEFTITLPLA